METPEEMLKAKKVRDLPRNLALHLTILIFSYGIFRPSYPDRVAINTILLHNLDDPDQTYDLPILRMDGQVPLQGCESYHEVATRLSRIGPEISEEQVRELLKSYPLDIKTPIYFLSRHASQNIKDERPDKWKVTTNFTNAIEVDVKAINAMLRKKKSRFRIVKKQTIIREA